MEQVTISPKFQVVIPRRLRERLRLQPGQKLRAIEIGGIVQLIPEMTMIEARGFLGRIDTSILSEPDREFGG